MTAMPDRAARRTLGGWGDMKCVQAALVYALAWPALVASADAAATCPGGIPVSLHSQPWLAAKFTQSQELCIPSTVHGPNGPGIVPEVAAELRLYDAAAPSAASTSAIDSRIHAGTSTFEPAAIAVPVVMFTRTQRRVMSIAPHVLDVARAYDIDPLLLHAIAHVESRHDPRARSSAGALGVMQVMPATARGFGVANAEVALFDPQLNLEVGAACLKSLQARFGNDLPLVLAGYNAGAEAVERHGRAVPPYPETRDYVRQVLQEYDALRREMGTAAMRVAP
jgi:soluble lytic murein transglycosylase-like protein